MHYSVLLLSEPDQEAASVADFDSPIDRVFTMSTYFWWPPPHNERPNTTTYARADIPALGSKYAMGLATGRSSGLEPTDAADLRETIQFASANPSIGTLGIWANSPTPDFMAAIGTWLHPAGALGGL